MSLAGSHNSVQVKRIGSRAKITYAQASSRRQKEMSSETNLFSTESGARILAKRCCESCGRRKQNFPIPESLRKRPHFVKA
ncbi:hypothetical protein TNCV_3399091 [Trichonephila clavipes]|nr:hypothetical protein TNCV_3399091 [Trichonephila clavipes]